MRSLSETWTLMIQAPVLVVCWEYLNLPFDGLFPAFLIFCQIFFCVLIGRPQRLSGSEVPLCVECADGEVQSRGIVLDL